MMTVFIRPVRSIKSEAEKKVGLARCKTKYVPKRKRRPGMVEGFAERKEMEAD